MADGLRSAQDNDQVRLDKRGVDASFTRNGNKPFVLHVVNEDGPAEGARLRWRQQALEIALTQLTAKPAGDENRLSLVSHADQLERPHRCGERLLTWILLSAGQRKGQRLDQDRRSPAPRRDRLERRPGERKSQRVTNCRACVGYPRRRRRGRRITSSSAAGTMTMRDPESSGTRRTTAIQAGRPRHRTTSVELRRAQDLDR